MSQTMQTIARFRELLSTLTLGKSTHHHKTLWGRLSDAYFFDALRDPGAAKPTSL
jgi:hypothetical protein